VTIDLSRSTTSSSLTFGLGGLRWATACSSGFFGACAEVDGAGGGGGLAPPAAVVLGPLGGNGTADAPGAIEMRLPVFGAGSGGGATKSKRGERCCKKAGGKKNTLFGLGVGLDIVLLGWRGRTRGGARLFIYAQ